MTEQTVTVEQAVQATSIPAGTFYSWRSRKQIEPVATNAAGEPLFRLDDVLALTARRVAHKLECAAKPKPPPKPRPKPAPRDHPTGELNPHWVGDAVGYHGAHRRLGNRRGKPSMCTFCGRDDDETKYHWALNWDVNPTTQANAAGKMEYSTNPDDYIRLCAACHKRFDVGHARDVAQRRVA